MTVTQQADFPLAQLMPYLTTEGWDVELEDALTAFRQDVHGAFRLVVDRSGRVYLRRTWSRSFGSGKTMHREGYAFAVHVEAQYVHDVMTVLDSVEAFPRILSTMYDLACSTEVMD